ncbi:hypothetical protein Hanom_Chr11g00984461 [Helianthus anomalus]
MYFRINRCKPLYLCPVAMATYYFSLSVIFFFSHAIVRANETFHYVNEGALASETEYLAFDAEYAPTYRVLPPFTSPFCLCFYNTTPNAYTLALRMGVERDRSVRRWV